MLQDVLFFDSREHTTPEIRMRLSLKDFKLKRNLYSAIYEAWKRMSVR